MNFKNVKGMACTMHLLAGLHLRFVIRGLARLRGLQPQELQAINSTLLSHVLLPHGLPTAQQPRPPQPHMATASSILSRPTLLLWYSQRCWPLNRQVTGFEGFTRWLSSNCASRLRPTLSLKRM